MQGLSVAKKTAAGAQVPSRNLTPNPSFEVGGAGDATGWALYDNQSVATNSIVAGRGSARAWRTTWAVASTTVKGVRKPGSGGGSISEALPGGWQPTRTYVVSFYAKLATFPSVAGGMGLAWNTAPASTVTLKNPNLTTGWQRYAFRITWGASVEALSRLYVNTAVATLAANSVDVDDVMVEEGADLHAYEAETPPFYTEAEVLAALRTQRYEFFRHELLRYTAPGQQVATFEAPENWVVGDAGGGGLLSSGLDAAIRRPGFATSLRMTMGQAGTRSGRLDLDVSPDRDYSAATLTELRIWVYVADETVTTLVVHLDSTNANWTNYYQWTVQKADGRWSVGKWSELRLTKASAVTSGAPTYALVTKLGLRATLAAGTAQGQVFWGDWRIVNVAAAAWLVVKNMDEVIRDSLSLEYNQYGRIKMKGRARIRDDGETIDWPNDRMRSYHLLRMPDGNYAEWAVSTMYISAPALPLTIGAARDADLYDVTVALEQATLTEWTTHAAGVNAVATAIAAIQAAVVGAQVIIPPSTRTLTMTRVWEPGTSVLTYVNELLAVAGYASVRGDPMGNFVSDTYVRPSQRGSEFTLADDGSSLFVRDTGTVRKDLFDAPNQWLIVVSRPDAALRAVYTLTDPANPLSTFQRGRTITRVVPLDLPDQAAADAEAKNYAEEGQLHYAEFGVQTPIIPVGHADRVTINHSRAPKDGGEYVEHTWRMECRAGGTIQHQYDALGTAVP